MLINLLAAAGAEVEYFDPYVPKIKLTREPPHWAGKQSIPWEASVVSKFDATLIATAHANVDYQELVAWSNLVIDTRNATRTQQPHSKIKLA